MAFTLASKMTSKGVSMNNLVCDLSLEEIDMVSGADQEAYKTWREIGIDTANAIEDAADYVAGFFAGIGEAFTNGE